jgi:hypothetical protein
MPSLSSLEGVAKAFAAFAIACALIGRADIPLRVIAQLRAKALKETTASWGCPSVFHGQNACNSYDPKRYRNNKEGNYR